MAQSVIDLFQQLARNEFGFFERLQTVSEIMSTNVPTVSSEVSIGEMIGRRDPLTVGSMAVIDAAKGDEIVRLLRDLNREDGVTIVMVTHNLDIVKATDRVVRMTNGIVTDDTPAAKRPSFHAPLLAAV